jgi:hypothetical protein
MINHSPFNQAIDCINALRDAYEAAERQGIQRGNLSATNGYCTAELTWPSNDYMMSKSRTLLLKLSIESRVEAPDADS